MKKHPSSVVAACVITIKKVSGSMVHTVCPRYFARYHRLSIYIIFNVYNDAMTQRPVCRGFLRVIICAVFPIQKLRRNPRKLRRAIIDAPLLSALLSRFTFQVSGFRYALP